MFTLYCRFNFLTSLFVSSGHIPITSSALKTVFLVVHEHPSIFLAAVICTVSSCFTNFAFPSHTCPAHSNLYNHINKNTSSNPSVKVWVFRIASISPIYDLPFPIAFAMCACQEQYFEISTPRYEYWSTIGSSSSHFHLKFTSLSSLHTTTVHIFTLAVTFHFLVFLQSFGFSGQIASSKA